MAARAAVARIVDRKLKAADAKDPGHLKYLRFLYDTGMRRRHD